MYKVIAEWDIGQDDLLFDTREEADEWIHENENLAEVARDNEASIDDLINDNLVGIVALTRMNR